MEHIGQPDQDESPHQSESSLKRQELQRVVDTKLISVSGDITGNTGNSVTLTFENGTTIDVSVRLNSGLTLDRLLGQRLIEVVGDDQSMDLEFENTEFLHIRG